MTIAQSYESFNSQKVYLGKDNKAMDEISPEKAKFIERLCSVCDALGYDPKKRQTQLAKKYDIKQPSTRKWFTGESMPSYEIAADLCKRSKVAYEWFMTGRGPKFIDLLPNVSPDIAHVVSAMENMTTWQRGQVVKIIDTVAEPAPKVANGDE